VDERVHWRQVFAAFVRVPVSHDLFFGGILFSSACR
jgi:hypothetical protein